ncbi:MAG: signal peptidase II [Acetivibrionales bacterium]|jgi:signal peptidase II
MKGISIIYFIIIPVIALIDQLAKAAALHYLGDGKDLTVVKDCIHFVIVKNYGAAFSILKGKQLLLKCITVPLILLLLCYLFHIFAGEDYSVLNKLSLSFIIGGAIGNLIDRIRLNYVVDYVRLNIRKFPVFNLADVFILIGSFMFIVYTFDQYTIF